MVCLTEARDQMMQKLHSLKTNAKDRLEENEQQLQALKDTNSQLKGLVNDAENEKERLKEEMDGIRLSKQVRIVSFFSSPEP